MLGNVIGIVQARLGSSRLPGKSLTPLLGRPMLQVIMERVLPAQRVDHWVIATTSLPMDDRIEDVARQLGVQSFRGSEKSLLQKRRRLLMLCPGMGILVMSIFKNRLE